MEEVAKIIGRYIAHASVVRTYAQERWIWLIVTLYTTDAGHLTRWLEHDIGKWFKRCGMDVPAKDGQYPRICAQIAQDLQGLRECVKGEWLNAWLTVK